MSQLLDQGELSTDVETCLDVPILARSVFDSVLASPVRTPNSDTPLVHALAREYLERGGLRRLIWLDTQDALPDGRTEGAAERESLIRLNSEGEWQLQGSSRCTVTSLSPPNTVKGSMTRTELRDLPLSEPRRLPTMPK